jgi:hypothetical protein
VNTRLFLTGLVLLCLTGVSGTTARGADARPDEIEFASAHASATRVASAADAWGGARSGSEATLSDRVVSYRIQATLDPVKHTVAGEERLTWRNRSSREVRSIYLHLYLNAFEGPGSTFFTESRVPGFAPRDDVRTRKGEWGHIALLQVRQGAAPVPWEFVHPDDGPSTDHTVVRLDLPQPVVAGGSATLDMTFMDQLPRVIARTGYFGSYHLVAQWFPKVGVLELPGERGADKPRWNVHEFHVDSEFYADYGLFDVSLTVPSAFTVGAVGEEQDPPVQDHGMTTHHFVQGDVHDFAWMADSRTATPLEGEYRGDGSPLVRVRVLFPPEYARCAQPVLQATLDSLAYFSHTLGPYPYRTVTAVIPPYNAGASGGMEYPTFFTADGFDNPAPHTFAGAELDYVTIHEFGHGYFYGILGSNEFEEPMLDEGINEFWDMRMMDDRFKPIIAGTHLSNLLGVSPTFTGFQEERALAMRSDPADGTGQNSWDRFSSFSFATVYFRTATMMHDLERAVGTPAMEHAFQAYYRRWRFRHPGIADLRDTLADATGQPALVESLFNSQVYATRQVDDRVTDITSDEALPRAGTREVDGQWIELTEDDARAEEKQTRQAWDKLHPKPAAGSGPYPYRTVVTVRRDGAPVPEVLQVTFADGTIERSRWDEPDRWHRFEWVKPVKAVSAILDPDGMNYLNANVLQQSRTTDADRHASRVLAGYADAVIDVVLALVAAL